MQVICTSLQTDNHTSTSSLNFYRPNALPDARPTNSVKAKNPTIAHENNQLVTGMRVHKYETVVSAERRFSCKAVVVRETCREWEGIWSQYSAYRVGQKVSCWLKAVNEITRTRALCKHDVIKVCSIEYLTTEIKLIVAKFQVLGRSQNYRISNVRTIV